MIRGLYSAAGGMQAMSTQQDATAQNLSHAMKPGYRREVVRFDAVGQHDDIISPMSSLHTDFTPGTFENTGAPLDVALDGPGFFSIQGPSGTLHTRNGVFQLNGQGQLVTSDGLPVLGSGGPVALPLTADKIEIFNDGSVVADGATIDQLVVTAFKNPGELQRAGSTYFQAAPDAEKLEVATGFRQGYRELGNTSVVHEMVQMLAGSRLFDATQRALRQISDTISFNTRPK